MSVQYPFCWTLFLHYSTTTIIVYLQFTEVSTNFSAWSFFDQPVKVISVRPDPPDPQFYYLPPESGMPLLESEKMTEVMKQAVEQQLPF